MTKTITVPESEEKIEARIDEIEQELEDERCIGAPEHVNCTWCELISEKNILEKVLDNRGGFEAVIGKGQRSCTAQFKLQDEAPINLRSGDTARLIIPTTDGDISIAVEAKKTHVNVDATSLPRENLET
jgi:hypothetical protein